MTTRQQQDSKPELGKNSPGVGRGRTEQEREAPARENQDFPGSSADHVGMDTRPEDVKRKSNKKSR